MAKNLPISAHYVAKSLPLSHIETRNELALATKRRNALIFGRPEDQMMIVFSFGVIVLFNFEPKRAAEVVKRVAGYGIEPVETPKAEEYAVVIDPEKKNSVEFDSIVMNTIDVNLIYIVAEVLAQSVAIEYVEEKVADTMGQFEKVTAGLERGGKIQMRDAQVLRTIGASRNIIQYVITQLSLLDKPDSTWEDKEIETAFIGMRKMFELEDRFRALEFRLNFIQDTSELVLDLLQNKRAVNMELSIIVLFVIDIVLVFYEIFLK